jgi:hypothetical protein
MPLPPRFTLGHSLLLAAFGSAIALVFFTACGNAKNPQQPSRPIVISDSKGVIPTIPTGPSGVAKNADGTHGKDHVDLEKLNGKIFEDWTNPNPRAVLVITGSQDGYIEPCGCAGLENQKGGMSRRHSMFKSLAKRGWTYGAIDTGGLIKGFGEQTKLKYDTALKSLSAMKYGAVGIGGPELSFSADHLIQYTADDEYRMISANVRTEQKDADDLVTDFQILTINGVRIGVTSVVGASQYTNFKENKLIYRTPSEGIKLVLPKLLDAKCNRLILLTYATRDESFKLAEEFPEFNDVVITDCGDEPPPTPEVKEFTKNGKTHKTEIIETGKKGMYAIALGFFDSQESPVRYQRIPLDGRFEDSPEITKVFTKYQEDLQALGLNGLLIKAGANAIAHPSGRTAYAGSEACGDCHATAYKIWKASPHSHATDTLVTRVPPRQFDPECISCHVTGWDPQHYYPYRGGYTGIKETAHLMQNGCENCHGPGQTHVDAELGNIKASADDQKKFRLEMRVAKEQSLCTKCHDGDNDPKFDFKTYWPQIEHKGKN